MKTRAAIKLIVFTLVLLALPCIGIGQTSKGGLPETVSYYEHVRPVFQVKCHGCHQPAKSRSGYVMTEVAALIAGRESSPAIVPNKPGESYLIELVTKQDSEDRSAMPPEGDPLTPHELSLVTR